MDSTFPKYWEKSKNAMKKKYANRVGIQYTKHFTHSTHEMFI